jgi:hypothetical protein
VGGFSIRRTPPKPRVADADALADWLIGTGHDDLVTVYQVSEPTKEAYALVKQTFEAEGELPPGCELAPASEALTVRGIK